SYVTITGGSVGGNAFAGGLGTSRVVSVKGKRYLTMSGGAVLGSIYAGSSLGDDASSESAIDAEAAEAGSSAYLIISAGDIGGSVYGGGYKGKTTGTTFLYIGYSAVGIKSFGNTISIGNSVYGGGDVGELAPGQPMFVDTMVYGGSQVYVNGYDNTFNFVGTFSAAGNSCLTAGDTSVLIEDLSIDNEIESVHRADTVTIQSSKLKFIGKINGTGDNTRYSFYDVGSLNLKAGSTIYLYAPMDEIGEYCSLNASGGYTKVSGPMNMIYICNGTMFEVKRTVAGNVVYGNVKGYTTLTIRTVENYYGALTLGAKGSPGGFVIEYDGTYREADTTEFDNCMCWYIAGSLQTVTSSTLIYDSESSASTVISEGHYITIPTMSASTFIRYSGGYFASDDGYSLVNPFAEPPEQITEGKYAILLGTNTQSRAFTLTLDGARGMYLRTFGATDNVVPFDNRPNQPVMEITAYGLNDNRNGYLGYGIIYLQEVVRVQYVDEHGDPAEAFIVQNRIEVRVDLFCEGSASTIDDYDATIQTIRGEGYADIILPSRLSDHTVRLVSASMGEINYPLTVADVKNNGGTTGWNYPLTSFPVDDGFAGPREIQSLTGAFVATLRISVTDFDAKGTEHADLVFEVLKPNGDPLDEEKRFFTVHLDVKKHPPVLVTFVITEGVEREYSFDYGITITEADCPNTMEHFVGWYSDEFYINQFNFNTPLVTDMTLHARYMYTVTFDYGNGTTSTMHVDIRDGGTPIYAPDKPVRRGYTFDGWYREIEYSNIWTFADPDHPEAAADLVDRDMILYAKWTGDP
ncbi:MAG: InlB B-repeat-containing protein, partial [Candidatus Methanomethylophilaceae archaeon]|nr:InlB B-repeat-containing protein [Candidatus Methanomethylophilaceae archaeon]